MDVPLNNLSLRVSRLMVVCSLRAPVRKLVTLAASKNALHTDRSAERVTSQSYLSGYGRRMICHMPFLLDVVEHPDDQLRVGALALSKAWGGELLHVSVQDSPPQIMNSLPGVNGLVHLSGDAAMLLPDGGSWLEALGNWQKPTILMIIPTSSGSIPGLASAYAVLCKELCVPLLGLLQIGGLWDPAARKLDGLPWCGWLPSTVLIESANGDLPFSEHDESCREVAGRLRRRMLAFGYT